MHSRNKALLNAALFNKQKADNPLSFTAPIATPLNETNAINGQLSITLKGNTVTQFVQNGNFANGTTGWVAANATISASNGTLSITGNGSNANPRAYKDIIFMPNRRYFARAKVKVLSSDATLVRLYAGGGASTIQIKIQEAPVQNTEYILYNVFDVTNLLPASIFVSHQYADAATSNSKTIQVKEVMLIDMGVSGSELYNLTADQMNQRFPYWLSYGTKSTLGGRLSSIGKNLFDGEKEVGTINITTGIDATDATAVRSKNFIKVKPNTSYTSKDFDQQATVTRIYFYDSNKNYISYAGASTYTRPVTTPVNAHYVRLVWINASITNKFQFEMGNTPTTYVPYEHTAVYFPDIGNSLPNDVKDELNVSEGKKIISTGEVVLNGTENWGDLSDSDDAYRCGIANWAIENNALQNVINSKFAVNAEGVFANLNEPILNAVSVNSIAIPSNNHLYVWILKSKINNYATVPAEGTPGHQQWENHIESPVLTSEYPYQAITYDSAINKILVVSTEKLYKKTPSPYRLRNITYGTTNIQSKYYKLVSGAWVYQGLLPVDGVFLPENTSMHILEANYDVYTSTSMTDVSFAANVEQNIDIPTLSSDLDKFKAYLAANPITLNYQLVTPITTIEPVSVVDQDGKPVLGLKSYGPNTTFIVEMDDPEDSTLPTVTIEKYPVA